MSRAKDPGSLPVPLNEVEMRAVHAGGPGGQHVNKAATAIHLFFDIRASSLPLSVQQRLLRQNSQAAKAGKIIIKAQRYRSLERNRHDALQRLAALIKAASTVPRQRKPTRISRKAKERRLDRKTRRGKVKSLRRRVRF